MMACRFLQLTFFTTDNRIVDNGIGSTIPVLMWMPQRRTPQVAPILVVFGKAHVGVSDTVVDQQVVDDVFLSMMKPWRLPYPALRATYASTDCAVKRAKPNPRGCVYLEGASVRARIVDNEANTGVPITLAEVQPGVS